MVPFFESFLHKLGIKIEANKGDTFKNIDNKKGVFIVGDNNKVSVNMKKDELKEKLEQILNLADPRYFEFLRKNNQVSILLTNDELSTLKEIEYSLLSNKIVRLESNGNMMQNRPDGKMRTGWVIYKLPSFD